MSKSPSSHNYHVTELFDQFINGTTLKSVLTTFRRICLLLDLEPGPFNQFYPTLKKGIACGKNWKSQSIFSKIEKKAYNKIYHASGSASGRSSGLGSTVGNHHHHHTGSSQGSNNNNVLKDNNCLVIGGGPCGLRTAIELQLLGARHVIITEKRDRFSRNNVLHLWPFVIADLKQLAGKKFYGKFCAGSIDHVSIRQLQLMLLKVALIIGCEFIENITFEEICPANIRSSRESLKETSPESEIDGSTVSKPKSSPPKRKLYSTSEEMESNKKGAHNSESTTHRDNQENNNNLSKSVKSVSDDCSDDLFPVDDEDQVGGDGNHNKTESRRLSICSCCCHLHTDCGSSFWSHLPKSYIGTYAHFSLTSSTPSTASTLVNYDLLLQKLNSYPFDILIGGDGRRNTLNDNFPRKEFRGKLAIAITANFINNHTLAEAQVPEISGISFIYHQEMFKSLYDETGIDLENICYYKDDTHYFVMTAKKSSLLQRGVLINDYSDTRALLASTNIDRSQLLAYARDAAKWTTGLDTPNFALNHYGEADVAMFDFTSMYAADNACRAKRIIRTGYNLPHNNCSRCNCDINGPCKKSKSDTINERGEDEENVDPYKESAIDIASEMNRNLAKFRNDEDHPEANGSSTDEGLLLIGLVGDSLLEPFWPTGSGCGRGFLSAMDTAWLARQWAIKKCKSIKDEERILQVLSERESIYRLLAQTKSENLSQNCSGYTINPVTRYPNLNSSTLLPNQCRHLLYDHLPLPVIEPRSRLTMAEKRARRATIATTFPFSGGNANSNNNGNNNSNVPTGDDDVIMTSRARVEREFMAISRERERNQRNSESNGDRHGRFCLTGSTIEDDESNLAAHREFEDSIAAFEENYRGLMVSDADPAQLNDSEGNQLLSSSVPNRSQIHNAANFGLDLSPSASNLITMAKSRARDIESAFRHRRQRQSQFVRSGGSFTVTDDDEVGGKTHQKAQQQCINHLRQQLRSKAAWFLDQKASEAANKKGDKESSSGSSIIKRESFNERIKDLEAKLYAASGLNYLSDEDSDGRGGHYEPAPIKLPSTKTGINVMMTASQLQQLFNPKLQEEKLRREARAKATKDIKYVGKISKQDWNVKPFEEGSTQSESAKVTTPRKPSSPPPKRVELFRDKLNEIQNKLEHIDDHHQPERKHNKSDSGNPGGSTGEWISMLKGELSEKVTRKPEIQAEPAILRRSPSTLANPFRKEARREAATASGHKTSSPGFNKLTKSPTSPLPPTEKITIVQKSGSIVSKVCAKCGLIVATVDKILVSGTLFHRSCLKCISCGATLRMSEVRNTHSPNTGTLASLITGSASVFNNSHRKDDPKSPREPGFNYKCTNCINGSGNSKESRVAASSIIGKLMGTQSVNSKSNLSSLSSTTSSSSTTTNSSRGTRTTIDSRMTNSLDGSFELADKNRFPAHNQMVTSSSSTDDYEARLKERMKWKEMFLLNNNKIDLTGASTVIDRVVIEGSPGNAGPSNGRSGEPGMGKKVGSPLGSGSALIKASETTPDSNRNRLNERIEYENISMTSEMVDDEELAKLLNLGSDHWESGGDDENDEDDDEDEDSEKDISDENNPQVRVHKKSTDSDRDEEEDDDDIDEDRQTTPSSSDSWDSSDSTDNDFDSDQFDESGISDNCNSTHQRNRHLTSPSLGNQEKLNHPSGHHHQLQHQQRSPTIVKPLREERLNLPSIVVHHEPEESSITSPTATSTTINSEQNESEPGLMSSDHTESTLSCQPNETSTAVTRPSSEIIISSDNVSSAPLTESTLKMENCQDLKVATDGNDQDAEEEESDKTEKNRSTSDDSDTINSKLNDLDEINPQTSTIEEKQFQKAFNELERKTIKPVDSKPIESKTKSSKGQQQLTPNRKTKVTSEDPTSSFSDKDIFDSDDDSRTSLSSLSINVSDTYDDINLLSVWEESGNCESDESPERTKQTEAKSGASRPTTDRSKQNAAKRKRNKLSCSGRDEKHHNNNLAKSKTDVAIPRTYRSSYPTRNDLSDHSPTKATGCEVYSRIPVLAARVIAANEGINVHLSETTNKRNSPTDKYKPSYSGSFTEKLLQRCRSSPSIPLVGDQLSKWSTPRVQSSSPTKVSAITKAFNAHSNTNNHNNASTTSTTKRQPSHSALPFADDNSHSPPHPSALTSPHQPQLSPSQSKQLNRTTNSSFANQLTKGSNKCSPTREASTKITIIETTAPSSSSSSFNTHKLFQAPRATFDEDMFDEEESFESSPGQPQSQQLTQLSSNHRYTKSPTKPQPISPDGNNPIKRKPIGVNYNY